MATEKMIEALKPLADAVFNDNGDMTVQLPTITSEDCIKAYFAVREAALSTDAEPVAWWWEDATGCLHIVMDRPYVKQMAAVVGCEPKPLYDRPQQPTPSVAVKVKQLEWKEDGKYLRARMGDREYSLNITADGKTWAGATRPYAFGANLTWSSVPNCSMVSLEEAKASCQADCQSRHDALSAQVQDVAEAVVALKEAEPYVELCHSLIAQKDSRKNVWRVLKKVRAAIAAAPAAKQGEGE